MRECGDSREYGLSPLPLMPLLFVVSHCLFAILGQAFYQTVGATATVSAYRLLPLSLTKVGRTLFGFRGRELHGLHRLSSQNACGDVVPAPIHPACSPINTGLHPTPPWSPTGSLDLLSGCWIGPSLFLYPMPPKALTLQIHVKKSSTAH